jgi:mannose-6-phosphate isomerase-like protein (cupin superfamily)
MNESRFISFPDGLSAPTSRRAALAGAAALTVAVATGAHAALGRELQGTPPPDQATGVTTQVLGSIEPPTAPGQTLSLLRIVFAPGASLPPHTHTGSTVYWIESGTLGFTLLSGEASIVRGADGASATATPAPAEAVAVGTETTVAAGDVLTFGESAAQTERTVGEEPVVILLTILAPTGAPFREPVEGTPAP